MDVAHQQPTPSNRVSIATKVFYGSGQGVDAVTQAAVNTFLLFYLTSICGMSGSAAGMIFFLSLAVDALLDPSIGRLSDRWRSRWGRRLPFMVVSTPLVALALFAIFSVPSTLGGWQLFTYVLFLNVILRVSLSVFALPHSALTAELTRDYSERSAISAFRALFIVVGTAACVLPVFSFIFDDQIGLQARSGYPLLGGWAALLIFVFGIFCVIGSAKAVLALRDPLEPGAEHSAAFFQDLMQLFRNPSFAPLFFGAVVVLVGQGASASLNLHAYRYLWELQASQIQLPLIVVPVGMLLGIPIAALLLKRLEKRDGVIGAVAVTAIYQAALPLLAQAGILEPGSAAAVAALVFNGGLYGAGGVVCFICFYSMIADAVDDHDNLFGVRREALYAAALMLGAKAATGLGALIAGVGLQAIGLSSELSSAGASVPSESTITNLGLLWGPGVGVLLAAGIPFLRRYPIDRQHHEQVLASLAARRVAAPVVLDQNPSRAL